MPKRKKRDRTQSKLKLIRDMHISVNRSANETIKLNSNLPQIRLNIFCVRNKITSQLFLSLSTMYWYIWNCGRIWNWRRRMKLSQATLKWSFLLLNILTPHQSSLVEATYRFNVYGLDITSRYSRSKQRMVCCHQYMCNKF